MQYNGKTITITYGEQAENHKGMQKIGQKGDEGFKLDELEIARKMFESKGYKCELIHLNSYLDKEIMGDPAYLLIVKNGTTCLLEDKTSDELLNEQSQLRVDKKAYMYGRVVNKNARHNLCFNDTSQKPNYKIGKGRVIAFKDVPITNRIRENLPKYIGDKAKDLKAEGNYYYDIKKCGIGYHGDTERMIVIGVRLGETLPICFQWYYKGKAIGQNIRFDLEHGDVYFMSEKTTGNDWKKTSLYTLRHAAGSDKFIKI